MHIELQADIQHHQIYESIFRPVKVYLSILFINKFGVGGKWVKFKFWVDDFCGASV